jgi:hypothetical protein
LAILLSSLFVYNQVRIFEPKALLTWFAVTTASLWLTFCLFSVPSIPNCRYPAYFGPSFYYYFQMGVIDEAALDCLSLVSEMTKHIHVKASGEKDTVPDLGHFSPVFVWLLRVIF